MATVFLENGRSTWSAKIRVWNAERGAWGWKKVSPGVKDREKAQTIADRLEEASGEAKAGTMTREKAEGLVSSILHLAGLKWASKTPSLQAIGDELFEGRQENIGESTRRKYAAHWKRFREWSGDKMKIPVDQWDSKAIVTYYRHLRAEFSDTTANNHLTTLSMVFLRAAAAGHIRGNPVELVERVDNDSIEKLPFNRAEVAAILRKMRRENEDAWCCLTLLGWHTGHRISDRLGFTDKHLIKDGDIWCIKFRPQKKARKKESRIVVLPLPDYVAKMLQRIKNFRSIHDADNRSGRVSDDFVEWIRRAGIDPLPVEKSARTIMRKSDQSFRHSMSSCLVAAGVNGELARLVTDHDSPKVHQTYVHAEILALQGALLEARRRK